MLACPSRSSDVARSAKDPLKEQLTRRAQHESLRAQLLESVRARGPRGLWSQHRPVRERNLAWPRLACTSLRGLSSGYTQRTSRAMEAWFHSWRPLHIWSTDSIALNPCSACRWRSPLLSWGDLETSVLLTLTSLNMLVQTRNGAMTCDVLTATAPCCLAIGIIFLSTLCTCRLRRGDTVSHTG